VDHITAAADSDLTAIGDFRRFSPSRPASWGSPLTRGSAWPSPLPELSLDTVTGAITSPPPGAGLRRSIADRAHDPRSFTKKGPDVRGQGPPSTWMAWLVGFTHQRNSTLIFSFNDLRDPNRT